MVRIVSQAKIQPGFKMMIFQEGSVCVFLFFVFLSKT